MSLPLAVLFWVVWALAVWWAFRRLCRAFDRRDLSRAVPTLPPVCCVCGRDVTGDEENGCRRCCPDHFQGAGA